MRSSRPARALAVTVAVAAALVAAPAAIASGPALGAHVSGCARDSLGKRAAPPTVTCIMDGEEHAFRNFGAMVAHMRAGGTTPTG